MAQTSSSSPDKRSRSIENEPIEAVTITCTICDAVFAPSPMYQSIMQVSAATLETLFFLLSLRLHLLKYLRSCPGSLYLPLPVVLQQYSLGKVRRQLFTIYQ